MTTRRGFVMYVFPDRHAEYKKRHDEIWPDMTAALTAAGFRNYSIFLNEATSQLFGYYECDSTAHTDTISATAVCQRWFAHMADVMETNADGTPRSTELRSVFFHQ